MLIFHNEPFGQIFDRWPDFCCKFLAIIGYISNGIDSILQNAFIRFVLAYALMSQT